MRQVGTDIIELRYGVHTLENALPNVEANVQTLLDLGANTHNGMLALQDQFALLKMEANVHLKRQARPTALTIVDRIRLTDL